MKNFIGLATFGLCLIPAPPIGAIVTPPTLRITSPSFVHQSSIPAKFTCQGSDISPALTWSNAPTGTKSFILIVDDPDAPDPRAPKMTWIHWVLYNIPADAAGLVENISVATLPKGTRRGKNSWKRSGYGGPCPPIGEHRYFHKLYALDIVLPDLKNPNKTRLLATAKGHILAQAELIGTYQKH